jgi:hypothetical protein
VATAAAVGWVSVSAPSVRCQPSTGWLTEMARGGKVVGWSATPISGITGDDELITASDTFVNPSSLAR